MYLGGYYLEAAKLPSRIGYEVAGVVTEAGPGVDESIVGQRFATSSRLLDEYVRLSG